MIIKVSTDQLRAASDSALGCIHKMQSNFASIEAVVKASSTYWEGEGQLAFYNTYMNRIESIERALDAFAENATDLQKIAGIYEVTETEITETADSLASDVIV